MAKVESETFFFRVACLGLKLFFSYHPLIPFTAHTCSLMISCCHFRRRKKKINTKIIFVRWFHPIPSDLSVCLSVCLCLWCVHVLIMCSPEPPKHSAQTHRFHITLPSTVLLGSLYNSDANSINCFYVITYLLLCWLKMIKKQLLSVLE